MAIGRASLSGKATGAPTRKTLRRPPCNLYWIISIKSWKMADANVLVLISANSEWRAVKDILSPSEIQSTPLGETFTIQLNSKLSATGKRGTVTPDTGVRLFHGGWGKISAAATTQYAIDHFHPQLLVNLGTCGGFEGRIQRGTIILVTKTIVYDIIEQMLDPEEAIKHYSTEMDLSW